MSPQPFQVTDTVNLGLPEEWQFEVATPLHIGSGEKLFYNTFDFRFDNGRLFYPDFGCIFPKGGITPKSNLSWEQDGVSGTPSWDGFGVTPLLIPKRENVYQEDKAEEVGGDSDNSTGDPIKDKLLKSKSKKEIGEIIGVDKLPDFAGPWTKASNDHEYIKLLNNQMLRQQRNVDRLTLPADYDPVNESIIQYVNRIIAETQKPVSTATTSRDHSATGAADAGVFSELLSGGVFIHQFIRDGMGCPYIPGSSLKGALRTILLSKRDQIKNNRRNENTRRPPNPNDNRDRGGGINGDIGRQFQVGDALSSVEDLSIYRLRIASQHSWTSIPAFAEALMPGTAITASIRIDKTLKRAAETHGKRLPDDQLWQKEQAFGDRGWLHLRSFLANYNTAIVSFTIERMERRMNTLGNVDDGRLCDALREASNWLKDTILTNPSSYMLMAFGAGWAGMTGIPALGGMMNINANHRAVSNQLTNTMNQLKSYGNRQYTADKPFPWSNKLVHVPGQGFRPMGWMKIM